MRLVPWTPDDMIRRVDDVLGVYSDAMGFRPEAAAARRSYLYTHVRQPGFRAVATVASDGALVGFGYGYHSAAGQWWHDVVTEELRARDPTAARHWFGDSFEIAEIHVLPEWQGQGIGRRLLERLAAARRERTAVLSTHTGPTVAHSLYRSYGFTDVLPEFYFPGSPHQPYTIMAAPLPLRARGRRRSARRSRA
jgi:GNAT superfamily N-acetyltransferase